MNMYTQGEARWVTSQCGALILTQQPQSDPRDSPGPRMQVGDRDLGYFEQTFPPSPWLLWVEGSRAQRGREHWLPTLFLYLEPWELLLSVVRVVQTQTLLFLPLSLLSSSCPRRLFCGTGDIGGRSFLVRERVLSGLLQHIKPHP